MGGRLFEPTICITVRAGIFIDTDDEILKVNDRILILIHWFLGYIFGPIFAL
jgi:hypothetical protein